MRDNTPDSPDSPDIRWDVLKSMLDDFPQLRDRAEQYLLQKRDPTQTSPTDPANPGVKKLFQKAVHDYRRERPLK
jgi:hypothetical protein